MSGKRGVTENIKEWTPVRFSGYFWERTKEVPGSIKIRDTGEGRTEGLESSHI